MHHFTVCRFRLVNRKSFSLASTIAAVFLQCSAPIGQALAVDCNSNGIDDDAEVSPGEQIAKLTAGDASLDDYFGCSVAIDEDTAIIGACRDDDDGSSSGSAYVFREIGGTWQQIAKLTADDGVANNRFGLSVSLDGNTAVVGAYGSADPWSGVGSAYVFREVNGNWQQIAQLAADDGAGSDYFGNSLSVSGDTVVVGAYGDQDNGLSSGSSYVFREIQGVWQQTAKLTAADATADGFFGASVALSGDTAVIGAFGDGGSNGGASYVFREIGGVWQQIAKLSAANPAMGDSFGWSVAIRGATAVIGASGDDDAADGSGAAYVFREIGGVWQQITKLVADDAEAFDWFGASVAISGDTTVIGAHGHDEGGSDQGASYVFREHGGVWRQIAKFKAADGVAGDEFGSTVAMTGNVAIIGAPKEGDGILNRSGAAYAFKLPNPDCNANGVLDECDIASATSADCNANGVADECESDCNSNGIPDECDFTELTSTDCNTNGLPDDCELAGNDCNSNHVPDECDIAGPTSTDCNRNLVPDDCEPAGMDCNANGLPDDCEFQVVISDQKIITTAADGANSVFAADIDGDGDVDVLSASEGDDKIAWYENVDGAGTFGPQRIITGVADGANSVFAADLDGDGDADVISSSSRDRKIAWYENTDGLGTFGSPLVINAGGDTPFSVIAADLGGDHNLDVLSATSGYADLAWYENIEGTGTFGPNQIIDTITGNVNSVFAADLDGDGDVDVLTTSSLDDEVAWYKNTEGVGVFGPRIVITSIADGAYSVFAADLDGDSDLDVLSASRLNEAITWYENTYGVGTFGPQQVVTTGIDFGLSVISVIAGDLDSDGDFDVLFASSRDDKIAWYENTDGHGKFGVQQVITIAAGGATSVITADIDGDGDIDVLSASPDDDKIAWYEVGTLNDCNNNGVHDECDIANAASLDCNNNAVPDDCELTLNDCNYNDVPDDCDVASLESIDCNANGVPDECEPDCNLNGLADACDIESMFSDDCNTNGVPDDCEPDCDENGVADECDITGGTGSDCNNNGTPDICEIAGGTAGDCNADGVPDDCEFQTVFSGQQVITTDVDIATSVSAADLDGDGDADVLSASYADDQIAWYENTDGLGTFGPMQVITTDANNARLVIARDMDGDGDLDALSASRPIAWYENIDGLGTFGPQRVIGSPIDSADSIFAVDIDGDSDLDLLATTPSGSRIAWFENLDGLGNFGFQQDVTTGPHVNSIFSVDLDGDGDNDLLSAISGDDTIAWYENTDGLGTFGPQQAITTSAFGAQAVFAADLDGDGDFDVLSASNEDNKIAWYENTAGPRRFGHQRIITTAAIGARFVFADDLDGDGDADVLSASGADDKIAWYENTDGLGGFGPQQVITTAADAALSAFAADLDGDGDRDVLSASELDDKIAWYENSTINDCNNNRIPDDCDIDGATSTDFNENSVPDECEDCNKNSILDYLELVDNDCNFNGVPDECDPDCNSNGAPDECDIDGLTSSDCNVNAIPDECDLALRTSSDCNNNDTPDECEIANGSADDCNANDVPDDCELQGVFSSEQVISTQANGANAVFATDLDGDGDVDVLSASDNDSKIAWYENTDGLGTFGSQQIITASASAVRSVFATDLDGDGDNDVLATGGVFGGWVASYENTDGMGGFGPQQIISSGFFDGQSVFAADMDGDGDTDALSASFSDDTIAWYENTDGQGTFGPRLVITNLADGALSVFSADLDGDGDFDVLSGSSLDGKVAWYGNTDGLGSFGVQQSIAGPVTVRSTMAADLDSDGDADVLYAGFSSVIWHENTDGQGSFGPGQILGQDAQSTRSVFAADLDGDGDIDVLSASSGDDKIAWYENTDGLANFGPQQVLSTTADSARSVFAADLDGDGDADVLSASYNDDKIAWYVNTGDDCNRNRIPDDCEADTDGDGLIDGCDPCAGGIASGDSDANGALNLADFAALEPCLSGPNDSLGAGCECFDFDDDSDIDLHDFAAFQAIFGP